ncbi:MAG: cation:proton antiporter [Nanoarchaeota archaeon]
MDTLTIVAISLSLSFILSEFFFRFKYPRVLGQLMAGLILGLPLIRVIFDPQVLDDISFLADLGIIFLLLLIGLELNLEKFKQATKNAIIIAISCTAVPFAFGFILMKMAGYTNIVALVVGACFSLSAEGTTLKLLLDMKILNTRVGMIILGAGILDDVLEVIFLSVVLVLSHKAATSIIFLPVKLIIFVVIVYITYKFFPFILRVIQKERSRIATLSFIIIFAIIVAVISKKLDLGPIVGAFIAGIILHLAEHKKYEHKENIKELEAITFAFIIPFFFINIGLHLNFSDLVSNIWLVILVLILATLGKIIGAIIVTPFTNLSLKQTHIIGWGMNSRGAVELVIADIARANNLIPIEVYSAIVIMAIVSTLILPLMIKWLVSDDRKVMS